MGLGHEWFTELAYAIPSNAREPHEPSHVFAVGSRSYGPKGVVEGRQPSVQANRSDINKKNAEYWGEIRTGFAEGQSSKLSLDTRLL